MVVDSSSFNLGGRGYGRVADVRYYPLSNEDRRELFDCWRELNPSAWSYIENTALDLYRRGHKRVSAKFLIEACRYLWPHKTVGVSYFDQNGKKRKFNIDNNITSVLGRVLLELHPELPIETRGK